VATFGMGGLLRDGWLSWGWVAKFQDGWLSREMGV
jgi:hypothetical protein